jgi:hypothetical protein
MSFEAFDRTLDLVATLRPLLDKVAAHDRDLEKQLRRAAASIGLNLSEGAERRGGDKRRLYTSRTARRPRCSPACASRLRSATSTSSRRSPHSSWPTA